MMKEDNSQKPASKHVHDVPQDETTKMHPVNDGEQENTTQEKKERKHSSAASIDAIISSPTNAVRSRRHTDTLATTGNNTSYEGATSNAAGGTGYNSGQTATGESIHTNSAYDEARIAQKKTKGENNKNDEEEDEPVKDII